MPHDRILTLEDLSRIVGVIISLGINRVRITGGEPLVRKGVTDFVRSVSNYGINDLSMTTNAVQLKKFVNELHEAGLKRVNISLVSLSPIRYEELTRGSRLEDTLQGIDAALEVGLVVKLNTVVLAGFTESEVDTFISYIWDRPITLRFIEFMPLCGSGWSKKMFLPNTQLQKHISLRYGIEPSAKEGVAEVYTLPGSRAKVGFISPITHPFCPECNRIRLKCDGTLLACLFSEKGMSLFKTLRSGASDEEIAHITRKAIYSKPKEYNIHISRSARIRSVGG